MTDQPPPPVALEITPPPTPTSTPRLEQVMIPEPTLAAQWKCTRGHVTPAIGLMFSAAMFGGDPNKGVLRDRKFCAVCLFEFLDKSGVSEVQRLEG